MIQSTRYIAVLLCALLTLSVQAQDTLQTEQQQYSYFLGLDIGKSLQRTGLEIDLDAFMAALKAALNDEPKLLTDEQLAEIRASLMIKMQQKAQAQASAQAETNRATGAAFLAENKTKEGVVTTGSGLQYKVIKQGDGAKPKASDTVTVHYRGTLLDGSEFDSSHKRGQPATFPLNGVIPGWTEGVQLMSVGSTYVFYVPSQLAYGERGAGKQIGPNSTLIFEVELLEIK